MIENPLEPRMIPIMGSLSNGGGSQDFGTSKFRTFSKETEHS